MPSATSKQRWLCLFRCFVANEPKALQTQPEDQGPAALECRISDASETINGDAKQADRSGRRRSANPGASKRVSGESASSGSSNSDATPMHGNWALTSATDAKATAPTTFWAADKPEPRHSSQHQQAAALAPCEEPSSTDQASIRRGDAHPSQATASAAFLLDYSAQHDQLPCDRSASCAAAAAAASHQQSPNVSSSCTAHTTPPTSCSSGSYVASSTAGFGIYGALVADRRAKMAAAASAVAASTCHPALPSHRSPAPPSPCPSAPHRRLQPIVTSLPPPLTPSSSCTGTSPAGSQNVSQSGGPGSPLCGIPDANASAFLSAVQDPSVRLSPPNLNPTHLLTPASLKAFNAVSSSSSVGKSRQLSSWGSSSYEASHPPSTQQAAATRSHHTTDHSQQQTATAGLQQLPSRSPAASQAHVAPSRLGLQAWQQPQEQTACSPQLASRVEALRHKLRSQSAELKTIAEQQQGLMRRGRCPPALGGVTPSGVHASSRASRSPARSAAAFAAPSFEFPRASPLLTTPVPGQRACCRAMEVEEEAGDEEEERSRHESTMSYLRMLSRSNTSFCTRLRRSNTQGLDASPQMVPTCASFGTKRSILGSMEEMM